MVFTNTWSAISTKKDKMFSTLFSERIAKMFHHIDQGKYIFAKGSLDSWGLIMVRCIGFM